MSKTDCEYWTHEWWQKEKKVADRLMIRCVQRLEPSMSLGMKYVLWDSQSQNQSIVWILQESIKNTSSPTFPPAFLHSLFSVQQSQQITSAFTQLFCITRQLTLLTASTIEIWCTLPSRTAHPKSTRWHCPPTILLSTAWKSKIRQKERWQFEYKIKSKLLRLPSHY